MIDGVVATAALRSRARVQNYFVDDSRDGYFY
jgi:hypothetical protein